MLTLWERSLSPFYRQKMTCPEFHSQKSAEWVLSHTKVTAKTDRLGREGVLGKDMAGPGEGQGCHQESRPKPSSACRPAPHTHGRASGLRSALPSLPSPGLRGALCTTGVTSHCYVGLSLDAQGGLMPLAFRADTPRLPCLLNNF